MDQLFAHLSRQLHQVCSTLSDAVQRRYHLYSSAATDPSSVQLVDDVARQLTALRAVTDYADKVPPVAQLGSVQCINRPPEVIAAYVFAQYFLGHIVCLA